MSVSIFARVSLTARFLPDSWDQRVDPASGKARSDVAWGSQCFKAAAAAALLLLCCVVLVLVLVLLLVCCWDNVGRSRRLKKGAPRLNQ